MAINRKPKRPDPCILCGKRPVLVKKRGLCGFCYQKLYREGMIEGIGLHGYSRKYADKDLDSIRSPKIINKYEHLGELEFIKNYFDHSNWIPQPANFCLDGLKYTPDFYDAERNVFIEVSRTRQAYSANKKKYQLFKRLFPKLNFEIRKPSGGLLNEDVSVYRELRKQ